MDDILNLKLFDETSYIDTSIFDKEMTVIIEEYDNLMDHSLYLTEAVKDVNRDVSKQLGGVIKNTVKTTKDVGRAYGQVTDIGGGLIKAGWDLCMKLLNIAIGAVGIVVKFIANIPIVLTKLIEKVESLAKRFGNKLKGNLSLYISYEDIVYLNKRLIFKILAEIISSGVAISNDVLWDKLAKDGDGLLEKLAKDKVENKAFKYCAQIIKNRLKIQDMSFQTSTVNLSDPSQRELYLGANIRREGESTYLGALNKLIQDITEHKTEIEQLGQAFKGKYKTAVESGQFASINLKIQKMIQQAIQDIAKSAIDISKILTYANKDINTINKAVEKIINKEGSQQPQQAQGTPQQNTK